MAISLVGNAAHNTSPDTTGIASQIGDLILIAVNRKDGGAITLPSGYSGIENSADTNRALTCWKYIESPNEAAPSIAGASNVIASIYRSNDKEIGIGNSISRAVNSSNTVIFDELTLDNDDGSSWVFAFHASGDSAYLEAVTGLTLTDDNKNWGINCVAETYDTNGGVSAWTEVSKSVSYKPYCTHVIEIKEIASSVSITDLTDPVVTDSTIVFDGSGFEALGANSKIEQTESSTTVELDDGTWADAQITTTSADVENTSLKYGDHNFKVTTHSEATAIITKPVIPATNNDYVNITGLATEGDRILGIVVGSQVRYQAFLYEDAVITAYPVVVNDNGTYTVDGSTPNGTYTFDVRIWDPSDETWGSIGTQTVVVGDGGTPPVDTTSSLIAPLIQPIFSNLITDIRRVDE